MSIGVQIVLMVLNQIVHTLVLMASWMLFCLIAPNSARVIAGMAMRCADKRLAEKANRASNATLSPPAPPTVVDHRWSFCGKCGTGGPLGPDGLVVAHPCERLAVENAEYANGKRATPGDWQRPGEWPPVPENWPA